MAIVSFLGLVGGATLTCVAPRTRIEREVDIAGALVVIAALALIGVQLSRTFCIG